MKVLLKFGADLNLQDDLARKPVECIPSDFSLYGEDAGEVIQQITELLSKGLEIKKPSEPFKRRKSISAIGKTYMKTLGLEVSRLLT